MLSLVRRELTLYFGSPSNVFMSLLGALISFILYVIYLYKHPFLGVKDLTYLTFANTQNLHFRAKTWFFTFFERSAFI